MSEEIKQEIEIIEKYLDRWAQALNKHYLSAKEWPFDEWFENTVKGLEK
jgi:hypothetical protein